MAFEVWADPGFQREFMDLPQPEQGAILASLKGLVSHPLEHPQLVRLKGTSFPGSFRLRVGRYRILGLVLDSPRLVLLTTVFLKKRDSDYVQAEHRHHGRLRDQGPPLSEYLKVAKRRR